MPGANLPELTQEITSISRDASEYPRRPIDGPDARLGIEEAGGEAVQELEKCSDVIFNDEEGSSLKRVENAKYVYLFVTFERKIVSDPAIARYDYVRRKIPRNETCSSCIQLIVPKEIFHTNRHIRKIIPSYALYSFVF